jgi:hypothetical protein
MFIVPMKKPNTAQFGCAELKLSFICQDLSDPPNCAGGKGLSLAIYKHVTPAG